MKAWPHRQTNWHTSHKLMRSIQLYLIARSQKQFLNCCLGHQFLCIRQVPSHKCCTLSQGLLQVLTNNTCRGSTNNSTSPYPTKPLTFPQLSWEWFDVLSSTTISITNFVLHKSLFPSAFSHAKVHPLLKKPSLDSSEGAHCTLHSSSLQRIYRLFNLDSVI